MKHTKTLAGLVAALTTLACTSVWAACTGGANTGAMNFNSGTGTWQSCKGDGTWTDLNTGGGGGTASCVTQQVYWGAGCNGSAASGAHGTVRSLSNSGACGYMGNAQYTCNNGIWSLTGGGNCYWDCPS